MPDPLLCSANYVGDEVVQLVFALPQGPIVLLDASSSLALHVLPVPPSTWSSLAGICIDGEHEQVVLLDAAGPRFLRIDLAALRAGTAQFQPTQLPLPWSTVRGIAFDFARDRIVGLVPETGALLQHSAAIATVLSPSAGTLSPAPRLLAFGFAPTAGFDHDLFVSSGDPRMLTSQWAWNDAGPDGGATLRATVATSAWLPPSPDPSGIGFDDIRDQLMVSDGEVEEMTLYEGRNVWEASRAGVVSRSTTTVGYSNEPVGIAFQSANRTFYISDDTTPDAVYVLAVGPDGLLHTADDTRRSFDVANFPTDPEDTAFDNARNELWIAGGITNAVHRLQPGPNGIFDGIPPVGDDLILTINVSTFGVTDSEGIAVRPSDGGIYVIGNPITTLLHLSNTGQFVRTVELPSTGLIKPAGIVFAPSSSGTGDSLYLVDRGIDNEFFPTENDGMMFEYEVPGSGVNQPPVVYAGPDLTIVLPAAANLAGTATDDGLPGPLTIQWSQLSGPGTTTFAAPGQAATTATFSVAGSYTLQLSAFDGEFTSTDTCVVTVQSPGAGGTVERVVAASADDAEQQTAAVNLTSNDIELVVDGVVTQVVGLRFLNVAIPAGHFVTSAYVQFTTDELTSIPTQLTIEGEASDNATAFATTAGNISSRPRTAAAVAWAPPAWTILNEAGANQRTPDLASILQEIMSRPGWSPGNAIALVITGTGTRIAVSYDRTPALAPRLIVNHAPVNQPPVVDAGPDLTILLTQAATLAGTATDDGLPGPLTIQWSQLSGPGTASFAAPGQAATTATFSATGSYTLQLSAFDGEFTSTDTCVVTVQQSGGGGPGTVERVIAASADDAEQSTWVNLVSSDLDLVVDCAASQVVGLRFANLAIPAGSAVTSAYVQFTTYEVTSTPTQLTIAGEASDNAATFVSVYNNISSRPRTAATVAWAPPAWTIVGEAGANQRTPDLASIVQEIVNRPGWSPGSAIVLVITGTGSRVAVTCDHNAVAAAKLVVDHAPVNQAPVVDAGPDVTTLLTAAANLAGTATDDGQPGPLTIQWSQLSGPGTASFAAPGQAATTATFSASGSYTLQLSAFDGELTSTDTCVVTVLAVNQPPAVDAGPDFHTTITSLTKHLAGHVADDGLPGGPLAVQWSQLSGPGPAIVTAPTQPVTDVVLVGLGTYVFQLSAFDGQFTRTDTCVITVTLL